MSVVNDEVMNKIVDESQLFSGHGMVRWKPSASRLREEPAGRNLLSLHLYSSFPYRMPKSYPRQRNYFGLYYFGQTGRHVWHESLNEAKMMAYLDHTQNIVAINSQPMEMVFADGGRHVPDLLALHADHRQVVYDVKPLENISVRVIEQFAKTQAICDRVGWEYQVLPGLPQQIQTNLTWLGHFKHPRFAAPAEATENLLSALDKSLAFDAAAALLSPDSLPHGRSALFHLLWRRTVVIDLTQPIDGKSPIERIPDAHR